MRLQGKHLWVEDAGFNFRYLYNLCYLRGILQWHFTGDTMSVDEIRMVRVAKKRYWSVWLIIDIRNIGDDMVNHSNKLEGCILGA